MEGARSITVSTEPEVRDGVKVVAKKALVLIVRDTLLMAEVVIVRLLIFVVGEAVIADGAGLGWSPAIASMFGRLWCAVEVEVEAEGEVEVEVGVYVTGTKVVCGVAVEIWEVVTASTKPGRG